MSLSPSSLQAEAEAEEDEWVKMNAFTEKMRLGCTADYSAQRVCHKIIPEVRFWVQEKDGLLAHHKGGKLKRFYFDMTQKTLHTAGLVVVKEEKLLLAYSKHKNAWYLPGGKLDAGETAKEALVREIKEELSIELIPDRLQYFGHTTAPAYGENENTVMEQECFSYDLQEKIQPSHEIGSVRYFSPDEYRLEPAQVVGVWKIFERLKA